MVIKAGKSHQMGIDQQTENVEFSSLMGFLFYVNGEE